MKKVLLLFCLGLSMQSLTVSGSNSYAKNVNRVTAVADDGTLWTDYAASNFEGGDGTAESPYQIKTANQLAKLAKDVYDGNSYAGTYFKMVSDIDLDGHNWFPIGYKKAEGDNVIGNNFSGVFDGDNHKIMNLSMSYSSDYKTVGLFGNTDKGFELRNLTIESGKLLGDMIVGSFVGSNNGIVENCVNKANTLCVFYYVGGIVGENYREGIVRHCTNYGSISGGEVGNGMSAGGIVGVNYNLVEENANFGDVVVMTSGGGGILGMLEGGLVRNCINRGKVSGPERIGGIVGDALGRGGNCEVYNCYNAGEIDCPATCGGVLGLAMFQNLNTLKLNKMYYDSDIFSGQSCGLVNDLFSKFDMTDLIGMSTEEMKAETFVTTLNNGSNAEDKIWVADTKNINDGYPILSYMGTESTGINNQNFSDNIKVYTTGGRIVVEGAEGKSMQVYSVDGQMVYNGKAADLNPTSGMYIVRVNNNSYKVLVK